MFPLDFAVISGPRYMPLHPGEHSVHECGIAALLFTAWLHFMHQITVCACAVGWPLHICSWYSRNTATDHMAIYPDIDLVFWGSRFLRLLIICAHTYIYIYCIFISLSIYIYIVYAGQTCWGAAGAGETCWHHERDGHKHAGRLCWYFKYSSYQNGIELQGFDLSGWQVWD